MQAVFQLSRRSIDQLETEIISLSEQINSKEYEFLVLIREFDLRQGWKPYHFNNCAEWLNFKCGMDLSTAREKVRVARCLFDLPKISDAFKTGALSYSKARCLTRVATPHNETQLLEHALKATAAQVQARCQGMHTDGCCPSVPRFPWPGSTTATTWATTCPTRELQILLNIPVKFFAQVIDFLDSSFRY